LHHHTPICHIKFSDWRWNQTIHVLSICFHRWPSHGLWAGPDGPNAATHAIPAAGCRTWSDVGIIPIISKLNLQSTNMLMLNIDLSPFAHLRCCWNKVCTNQKWVSYWQYLLKQFLPWTRRGSAEGAIEILYVSNLTQQTVWFVNSVPFQTPTFFSLWLRDTHPPAFQILHCQFGGEIMAWRWPLLHLLCTGSVFPVLILQAACNAISVRWPVHPILQLTI